MSESFDVESVVDRTIVISIEGGDSSGKATQSALLANVLREQGKRVSVVEVPVRDRFTHGLIYWTLSNGLAKNFPRAFQLLHFVNKAAWQITDLPKLMRENDVIILDRWNASARIYGAATGVSTDSFVGGLYYSLMRPDFTFCLQSRPATEMRDDYERDASLQARVEKGYFTWALRSSPLQKRYVVYGQGSIEETHRAICDILRNFSFLTSRRST